MIQPSFESGKSARDAQGIPEVLYLGLVAGFPEDYCCRRKAQRSISITFGGWPVRRIPIRKIFPLIHNAMAVVDSNNTKVPIKSNNGGSAAARFIIVKGV